MRLSADGLPGCAAEGRAVLFEGVSQPYAVLGEEQHDTTAGPITALHLATTVPPDARVGARRVELRCLTAIAPSAQNSNPLSQIAVFVMVAGVLVLLVLGLLLVRAVRQSRTRRSPPPGSRSGRDRW